jgi:hypothetical protein
MGLDVLFGVVVAAFLAAWAIWLISISSDRRATILGTTVLVFLLAGAIVIVNGQRLDDQRDEYRADIERFIGEVEVAEEAAFAEQGSYTEDLSVVSEGPQAIDPGLLQMEVDLEPKLDGVSKDGYSVTGKIESQEYTLTVARSASGEIEETRTCSADASAGCIDGLW